jgi:flavodoxin
MNTIVFYDSFFGNTKSIAFEIGKLLGEDVPVIDVKLYTYNGFDDLERIIIGSPTRAFRPTKDIMQLLKNMKLLKNKVQVSIFDTRIHIEPNHPFLLRKLVRYFGYANDTMMKKLQQNKNVKFMTSMAFYVDGTEGPISPNEMEKIEDFVKLV